MGPLCVGGVRNNSCAVPGLMTRIEFCITILPSSSYNNFHTYKNICSWWSKSACRTFYSAHISDVILWLKTKTLYTHESGNVPFSTYMVSKTNFSTLDKKRGFSKFWKGVIPIIVSCYTAIVYNKGSIGDGQNISHKRKYV